MASATVRSRSSCLWIGDPQSNRAQFFEQARQAQGLAPSFQISYAQLLQSGLPQGRIWDEVRLESAGKSLELERAFIEYGGDLSFGQDPLEHGRLYAPASWYRGFCRMLRQLPPDLPYHNAPAEIEVLFDKRRTHQRLTQAGLAVAPSLGPISNYQELRQALEREGVERAFLKVFCGSSCSGSVAYLRGDEVCFTTVERASPGRYFNSRRVRRYPKPVAVEIIDWLGSQGLQAEVWLPKARSQGLPFDLRLVTIAGKVRQRVMRQGHTPMLGLHLGSRRGDLQALDLWLGDSARARIEELAEAVAALFPGCLYLGVDILIQPDKTPVVLEVNAFGDLLPGVLWQGMDTYTTELWARNSA